MISDGKGKSETFVQSFARLDQKRRKTWRKFWVFIKSLWKIEFFHTFLLTFLGVLHPLRKFIPLEDDTRFLQPFFPFQGGGTFRRSPPAEATAHFRDPLFFRGWIFILSAGGFKQQCIIYLCNYTSIVFYCLMI